MAPSFRTTSGTVLPAVTGTEVAAMAVLDCVLAESGIAARTLAPDHRGLSVDVAGWALDIGVCVQDGMLRAQAEVCGHGQIEPHDLLHDHRKRTFIRFSHADGGAVWVEGELPLLAATPELVDAMLGALLEAAALARERARASSDH